jgi:hypothetical protein
MKGSHAQSFEHLEQILAEDPSSDDLLEACERIAEGGLLPALIQTWTPDQPHPHLCRCIAFIVAQIADTQPATALALAAELHRVAFVRSDQTVLINLLTALQRASINLDAGPLNQPEIINILRDGFEGSEPVRLTLVGALEALTDQENLTEAEWDQVRAFHNPGVNDDASGELAELLVVDHA